MTAYIDGLEHFLLCLIVQEMLGHATITQTMDTYSHVLPGMGDVAASALEEALG